ncbi:hypothetical protein [Undibacterium rugosum]|uniref:hypothetical protein n=1 Tax=Undibacterium rugosum TaxID=2762291 RepID=UPI001B837ACD|nr:hypothetical protein [Undibacterium rugosum]MBR7780220.1 hypothetical protein [Undibacterium rugosum]
MKAKYIAISTLAMALMAGITGSAQAASSSADVQMILNISSNASACTVTPSAASFNLPNGKATQGARDWMQASGITTPSLAGVPSRTTLGTSLDQVVTIACGQPSTPITSILVAPSGAQYPGLPGLAYMLDNAGNAAGGKSGGLATSAELVSVTSQANPSGAPAPFSFMNAQSGAAQSYVKPFATSATMTASGTYNASFAWHPLFFVSGNSPLGDASGGSFKTPWVVTVNY